MDLFNKTFSDFLAVRMGERLTWLRENNNKYADYLKERSTIIEQEYENIDEYKKTYNRLLELNTLISDIENNYLFIMGMREKLTIENSLFSDEFIKEFIGT